MPWKPVLGSRARREANQQALPETSCGGGHGAESGSGLGCRARAVLRWGCRPLPALLGHAASLLFPCLQNGDRHTGIGEPSEGGACVRAQHRLGWMRPRRGALLLPQHCPEHPVSVGVCVPSSAGATAKSPGAPGPPLRGSLTRPGVGLGLGDLTAARV